jgi:UDP-N-acetylglucosamine 2-epimerase (non-hydrolysing)
VSDINLPYSTIAREYLLAEGIPPDRVIKTGSPMFEVLTYYRKGIEASDVLQRLNLKKGEYFLVSVHREENVDNQKQLMKLVGSLNAMAELHKLPIIVSTHPRTRQQVERSGSVFNSLVQLSKPFGFLDYIALQTNARVTLSDSGTISEESSILNFPAINLRETHERPEAMEEMPLILTGLERERILDAINQVQGQGRGEERDYRVVEDYCCPNVSEKVVRIILSYTDYVRRTVWKQY